MQRLNDLIQFAPVTVVATVVNKAQLTEQYSDPANPYKLALGFCLERAYQFLKSKDQHTRLTHVIVEARGEKEDKDLELEFRRICQGRNYHKQSYQLELLFGKKAVNSGGLQLADLFARPIGLHVLRPEQPNRAYEIIQTKLRQDESGGIKGYGLKVFP